MGAIEKQATIKGKDLRTAFKNLQDCDREDYGCNVYSGGWNNAQGAVEVSRKEYQDYLVNGVTKHEPAVAFCITKPIGNNMKTKTSVTNYPAKGTRKWVTKYQVNHPQWGNVLVSENKQADAIKKARELVEKNPDWILKVQITKVLESGETKVAIVNYKKSSTERDGVWEVNGTMPY
tara:strand:- start:74 stop:604 length:531 start_codon:yes stop_codon:yes gene_type:complete